MSALVEVLIDELAALRRRVDTLERIERSKPILHNYAATAAPGAGDDSADGYSVGSVWIDVTNDDAYICVDATATAAVWLATATS
jgi:hypothetical protein